MNKSLAILLALILVSACGEAPDQEIDGSFAPVSESGRRYIEILATEISAADRIVVTEHSFELDAYDEQLGKSRIAEPIIYATLELSATQKRQFSRLASEISPITEDGSLLCIFEPHHSIAFYTSGIETSVMHICFSCGEVRWLKANLIPPAKLDEELSKFILSIGMQPERDWVEMAEARLADGA